MKKLLLIILVLALLAININCGSSSSGSNGSSLVSITVDGGGQSASVKIEKNTLFAQAKMFVRNLIKSDFAVAAIPSNVNNILFTISAPDMTTITRNVPVSGQSSITETFTVPNGNNRHFLVEAMDSTGNVLYKGETSAYLDGRPITLDIDMVDITPPNVYYVDARNVPGPGNGTLANPFIKIQDGINVASAEDMVQVAAGTYNENIVMKSRVDVIGSGAGVTTIVGQASVSGVVLFDNVTNAKLSGFKITVNAPIPGTDRAVVFQGMTNATAVLQKCVLTGTQYGIFVWAPAAPSIENNTIVGISNEQGIYIGNSATSPIIRNNIITGYTIFAGIHVVAGNTPPLPVIEYNNLWNNATNYKNYPDQTGINGNISADPLFISAIDFHLQAGSPCINSGDPSSPIDPDGTRADMGAFPFPPAPPEVSPPEDIALNLTGSGFPHPLESDKGWGGGSYPWEIVDSKRLCPTEGGWACGLAFTGGSASWGGETCGWRQATINLGEPKAFNRVVVWHHGLEHVPNTYKIQYWDGTNWVDVFSTTNGHSYLKFPTDSPRYWWESWSTPTENTFPLVTSGKVRFALYNCDITHGWIYEFEVYKD